MPQKIHIFTDKSSVSEHNTELLVKGIRASHVQCNVAVKDLAQTPEAAHRSPHSGDPHAVEADVFLFPTTGALSVFEKHYLSDDDPAQEQRLAGKKFGVLMTRRTTFDGPTATQDHPLDSRLVERLRAHGLAENPVVLAHHDPEEREIVDAGKHFAEKLLQGRLH